ncbi:ComEC/Rec2 family competence protein [soil metagenome]
MRDADFRLVPAAIAAWAATAAGLLLPPGPVAAGGALAAIVAVVALVAGRGWAAALAVALAFGSAAALVTAVRVADRDASVLVGLAGYGRQVELDLALSDDPRSLPGGFSGAGRVLVPATASAVHHDGQIWRVDDDVIVLAEAEGWLGLLPGQRLRGTGTLLPPRGGDLVAAALAARGPPELQGQPSPLQRGAGSLRDGLVEAAHALPEGPRGLLPGLVVGDISGMDPLLEEQFRATGLTHLVAVSGANCAIVVGAVLWLLRWLGVPRVPLALAAGLALAGFVVLARPSPSVVRAVAMGAVALLALAAGRPKPAIPALAAAVLVLVFVSPSLVLSPGFALSVAATTGIMVLAPGWTRALKARRVPAGVAEAIAVALSAGLSTAPLIAGLSASVSLVSVPANLLAAPAVPPATILGVLATVVAPVSAPAAAGLAWLAGWPTRWLVLVAEHGSGLRDATLPWPGSVRGALLLAVILAVALVATGRSVALRRLTAAVVVGLVVFGLPARTLVTGWPPPGWLFVACDVGQGDALVVRAGVDQAIVIDTGPDPVTVDECLRDLGVDRVPLLVLTHLHADHAGGLAGVLRSRSVGVIQTGPLPEPGPAWADVVQIAAAGGVPTETAAVGEVREVAGVRIEVLWPAEAARGSRSDANNSSLVLRVSSAGMSILLTGDMEIEAQQALLRSEVELRADVWKVPHHGSAYQHEAFLAEVQASLAVISFGADNDYGHPAPSLLGLLHGLGMQVSRTDQDGAVAVGLGADDTVWVAERSRGSPDP